jgi:hypothetical protein
MKTKKILFAAFLIFSLKSFSGKEPELTTSGSKKNKGSIISSATRIKRADPVFKSQAIPCFLPLPKKSQNMEMKILSFNPRVKFRISRNMNFILSYN